MPKPDRSPNRVSLCSIGPIAFCSCLQYHVFFRVQAHKALGQMPNRPAVRRQIHRQPCPDERISPLMSPHPCCCCHADGLRENRSRGDSTRSPRPQIPQPSASSASAPLPLWAPFASVRSGSLAGWPSKSDSDLTNTVLRGSHPAVNHRRLIRFLYGFCPGRAQAWQGLESAGYYGSFYGL